MAHSRIGFKHLQIVVDSRQRPLKLLTEAKGRGHSNAFFTGFGKFGRIVLYDTLLEQMEETEIEAVLAHEVGHYRKGTSPEVGNLFRKWAGNLRLDCLCSSK